MDNLFNTASACGVGLTDGRVVWVCVSEVTNVGWAGIGVGREPLPSAFEVCERDSGSSYPREIPLIILRAETESLFTPKPSYAMLTCFPDRMTEGIIR
jgi:hypothetical protein